MDVAYYIGQRSADCLMLSIVNIRDGMLEYRQCKTGKPQRVAITGQLTELLNRIETRKAEHQVHSMYLLVDERGQKMTKAKLRSRFEKAREDTGIACKDFKFRDLRRKSGSDLRDQHGLGAAQTLLGHSSSGPEWAAIALSGGTPSIICNATSATLASMLRRFMFYSDRPRRIRKSTGPQSIPQRVSPHGQMPMKKSPEIVGSPRRRRDAATTRSEILAAAIRLFAERNYDTVGLREIVAAVGVDVSMVKRYFGSKKGLYAEVIEIGNSVGGTRRFFEGHHSDRNDIAEQLARFVADIDIDDESRQAHLYSLLLLLRAPHSQSTEPMMHKHMEEHVLRPIAKWLGGPHAAERAALITAYLLGLGTMQRLIKVDAFTNGDLNVVIDYVKSAIQTCIDGMLPKPAKNAVKRGTMGMKKMTAVGK